MSLIPPLRLFSLFPYTARVPVAGRLTTFRPWKTRLDFGLPESMSLTGGAAARGADDVPAWRVSGYRVVARAPLAQDRFQPYRLGGEVDPQRPSTFLTVEPYSPSGPAPTIPNRFLAQVDRDPVREENLAALLQQDAFRLPWIGLGLRVQADGQGGVEAVSIAPSVVPQVWALGTTPLPDRAAISARVVFPVLGPAPPAPPVPPAPPPAAELAAPVATPVSTPAPEVPAVSPSAPSPVPGPETPTPGAPPGLPPSATTPPDRPGLPDNAVSRSPTLPEPVRVNQALSLQRGPGAALSAGVQVAQTLLAQAQPTPPRMETAWISDWLSGRIQGTYVPQAFRPGEVRPLAFAGETAPVSEISLNGGGLSGGAMMSGQFAGSALLRRFRLTETA